MSASPAIGTLGHLATTAFGLVAVGCAAPAPAPARWHDLLEGDARARWRTTSFGGEGDVTVEPGIVTLDFGSPLTGITWDGEWPTRRDYEIEVLACRVEGSDFFCGLTFPVGEDHLTLVVGGWGAGTLVGISSLDGLDASENETCSHHKFELGRTYSIRVRVAGTRVTATIDDATVADVDTAGRELSLRAEVEPSRPLGIAAFRTRAEIRGLRWRPL